MAGLQIRPGEKSSIKYLPMRITTTRNIRVFDLMTGHEEEEDEADGRPSHNKDNKSQTPSATVS